ncbi:hypothetical protein EAH_00029440 [Eimeria acervulina]|uniref:Uncharacterized protein n=1 Tax=Eimeria acervulina TaxID=5801 RepID=U6GD56_EIMAC|nr:hypothetical protein EAH_00029440 [Eimeria acervulina]CDI78050.1 hypothetical protein EAH_00029440 [Eimeria acervulina]
MLLAESVHNNVNASEGSTDVRPSAFRVLFDDAGVPGTNLGRASQHIDLNGAIWRPCAGPPLSHPLQ